MAAITVLKENVPHGPFTRAEVAAKLNSGEITLDSLAFVEGLTQWTPLRDVLAKVDGAVPPSSPSPASVPASAAFAPSTATVGPVSSPNSPIAADYSYAVTMQPPGHLIYAGFWLRVAAFFVDGIIILVAALILGVCVGFAAGTLIVIIGRDSEKSVLSMVDLGVGLMAIIGQWLYFALQESSRAQATLGKRLLGIYVTDRQGNRIDFRRATGRYFGKIISGLILYIGFMMAGWTERKQALHDILADTLVVRKPGS